MKRSKISLQFIMLTFCIAYCVAGILIFWGRFGYSVYNWVDTFQQFLMNVPFSAYILSPAIASFVVLRKNNNVSGFKEWLRTVFYYKNNIFLYLLVIAGLILYFGTHIAVSGYNEVNFSFYTFLLSLPGGIIIGGLEEAGWMYVLQPEFDKRYGFVLASIYVGVIWVFWHIPLFFIPGTSHYEGLINFWMFNVQVMSFSFFRGAVYKVSGKGHVFVFMLFHAMFNAASPMFGTMTMKWEGTLAANAAMLLLSFVIVAIYNKKEKIKDI